jgi:hypothetical protein
MGERQRHITVESTNDKLVQCVGGRERFGLGKKKACHPWNVHNGLP